MAMVITVDLDSKDKANLLDKYREALRFGKTEVTETVKGFHLRIHSRIKDIWEIQRIRKLLGDDLRRLEHDEIVIRMGYPELANRLFERKKPLGSRKWVREKPVKLEELIE